MKFMKILKCNIKSCIGYNVYYTIWSSKYNNQMYVIGSLWHLRSIVRNFLYDYNSLPSREKVN
jgi:hypothetical protein